jgi:hypothetical protein
MDFYKYSIPIDIIKHDCADMSFLFFLGDYRLMPCFEEQTLMLLKPQIYRQFIIN